MSKQLLLASLAASAHFTFSMSNDASVLYLPNAHVNASLGRSSLDNVALSGRSYGISNL